MVKVLLVDPALATLADRFAGGANITRFLAGEPVHDQVAAEQSASVR